MVMTFVNAILSIAITGFFVNLLLSVGMYNYLINHVNIEIMTLIISYATYTLIFSLLFYHTYDDFDFLKPAKKKYDMLLIFGIATICTICTIIGVFGLSLLLYVDLDIFIRIIIIILIYIVFFLLGFYSMFYDELDFENLKAAKKEYNIFREKTEDEYRDLTRNAGDPPDDVTLKILLFPLA